MDYNKVVKEIMYGDSKKGFAELELGVKSGEVDLSKIDNKILSKTSEDIIKKRYKLTENQISTVNFIFWISYFVEREIHELIVKGENIEVDSPINNMLDRLSFGDKIAIIKEYYIKEPKNNNSLISILRQINILRNDIAHGRLDKLQYKKQALDNPITQMKLAVDLMNAFRSVAEDN